MDSESVSKHIEVDEEVFRELQKLAEPLVDTPNTVLRRVLLGRERSDVGDRLPHSGDARKAPSEAPGTEPTGSRRAPSHQLFPKEGFTAPILQALMELNGSARPKDIMDLVFPKIQDQLNPLDLEKPAHGGIRWLSRANFHRYELLANGYIETPKRGMWTITEKGQQFLSQHT